MADENTNVNIITEQSHPVSMNDKPDYGAKMPSGGRAMGSFDVAFDGHTPISQDLSLLRDFTPLKPGQRHGQRGTTIYNPKPEDPEQEAIYGKKVYKEKISQEDPRAVIDKMNAQNKEIADLKSQLAMLVKIVSAQDVAKDEASNASNLPQDESKAYEDMKYQQLVKLAKERGIEDLKGISKEGVVIKLRELDSTNG